MRYFLVDDVKHWIKPCVLTLQVDGKPVTKEAYVTTHSLMEEFCYSGVREKYKLRKDVFLKCKALAEYALCLHTNELAAYQKLAGCDFVPKLYEHSCVPYKIYDHSDTYVETYYVTCLVLEHCGEAVWTLYPLLQIRQEKVVVVPLSTPQKNMFLSVDTMVDVAKQIAQIMVRLTAEFHLKQHDNHTGNYCYNPKTHIVKLIDLEDVR